MDHKNPVSGGGDGVLLFRYPVEICKLRWLQIMASDMQLELCQIWGRFRAYHQFCCGLENLNLCFYSIYLQTYQTIGLTRFPISFNCLNILNVNIR
jgi:hypothetical protein